MNLQLSAKRYQLDIPPALWAEFFAQLTEDHRGRPVALKLLTHQLSELDVLRPTPLQSITYDRSPQGHDLIVTVSGSGDRDRATYAHRIVYPQVVTLITDDDGIILTCTITDNDHTQTVLSFQPEESLRP